VPPVDLVKIGDDSFLASVMKKRKRSLTETVPQDIEPREALANIKECVASLNKLGNATSVVGAILGQHMAIMAKRPEILGASGYETLHEFEEKEIQGKLSHGNIWNWKAIASAFPEEPIERVLEIGSTNLIKAARVCKQIDASPSQKKKILDKAAELNTAEFTGWLEKKSGIVSPGDTTTDKFELFGSSAEIAELKEHLADGRLVELAGDTRPIRVVLAALASFTTEETGVPVNGAVQSGADDEGDVQW
jgi:hypothetical protein